MQQEQSLMRRLARILSNLVYLLGRLIGGVTSGTAVNALLWQFFAGFEEAQTC